MSSWWRINAQECHFPNACCMLKMWTWAAGRLRPFYVCEAHMEPPEEDSLHEEFRIACLPVSLPGSNASSSALLLDATGHRLPSLTDQKAKAHDFGVVGPLPLQFSFMARPGDGQWLRSGQRPRVTLAAGSCY